MRRHLPIGLAILFALGCALLARPPAEPPRSPEHQRPLLPRAELLNVVGAGYRQLVADYLWLLAVHQTGIARTQQEYLDVYYYLDLITDVDPEFKYAYRFGGMVVPFNRGRETWVNTAEATRLVEKGRRRFPADTWLMMIHAYNLSYFEHRYRDAADVLASISYAPAAPQYLSELATRLYAEAGDIDAGQALARQLAESALDPEARASFEKRVLELEREKVLRALDAAIATYRAREGELPPDLQALVAAGELPAIPKDPLEGELYLGDDGRAYSTSDPNRRLEVYDPRKKMKPLPQ